jgi:hypothetical protein
MQNPCALNIVHRAESDWLWRSPAGVRQNQGPGVRYEKETRMLRTMLAVLGSALAATAIVAAAQAANPEAPLADIQCGDAHYQAAVTSGGSDNANNLFTPAHLVGGGILVPVAFSNQHATFTDPDGNVFTDDEPDVSHHAPPNADLLSCHFTATFDDPRGGSGTLEGDVVGFIAGNHP